MKQGIDQEAQESKGRVFTGDVVSDKMDKTAVVRVVRTLLHPLYGKVIRRNKKYKVHDEENSVRVGDVVEIKECRPYSKTKHMTVVRVLSKNKV
jgi:small subunit ribosomal protein S17